MRVSGTNEGDDPGGGVPGVPVAVPARQERTKFRTAGSVAWAAGQATPTRVGERPLTGQWVTPRRG